MERLVTASGYEGVLRNKSVRPELVGRLGRCGHMYHLLCLVAMYSNGNKVGHKVGCRACSGWVPGSELGSGWGPGGGPQGPQTSTPFPGRQPAVPHLQSHLRGEDRDAAAREDGVSRHPTLAARLRRHPDHPHRL